ncbi:MAG: hypothetical protein U0797_15335 [Gemmataceae bacterium]
MNEIQALQERVSKRFPTAKITLDPSGRPTGSWFLDITLDDQPVVVEWRAGRGFGINASRTTAYGEGPDEIVSDLETACHLVVGILAGARTCLLHGMDRSLGLGEAARRLGDDTSQGD